jgi:hypothetical protein
MRWIDKTGPPPKALEEFLNIQRPVGVNLDCGSFTRKPQLRQELIAQQMGLCALTGVEIDARLGEVAPDGQVTAASGAKLKIKAHNAHLKPQSVCRQETIARGDEPGRVVGEDMDYRNIVAAVLVEGADDEMFGAAAQKDKLLRVKSTDNGCDTLETLKLGHRTLVGWRKEAIGVFTDPEIFTSKADLDAVIAAMDAPVAGKLPAYCFAIKQVAMRLRS